MVYLPPEITRVDVFAGAAPVPWDAPALPTPLADLRRAETTHYYAYDGWTPALLCGESPFPDVGGVGPPTTDDPALVTCPGCLEKLSGRGRDKRGTCRG